MTFTAVAQVKVFILPPFKTVLSHVDGHPSSQYRAQDISPTSLNFKYQV